MVVIERVTSLSSSSSSRKTRKTSLGYETDNHELIKVLSSPSSSRKTSKTSLGYEIDNHELTKVKSVKRASSFSSIKKEKQLLVYPKDGTERLKSKLIKKSSSFSALPSPLRKEKLVRGTSTLSTSNVESPKRVRKTLTSPSKKSAETRKSGTLKSRFINKCKDDIDVFFDKQIDEGTMINPGDCFWLSSGNLSPHEINLIMNAAIDPSLDELVISFLPKASNPPVDEKVLEDSSSSSKCMALSTHTNNSAFWNLDRTGVWVSLINLECEDSKLVSDSISGNEELDSDFPSPTYEHNWDSYSSDVGISSSARSTTQESSHSDWSSDLLSDSLDWELDSDDPIFWPFGLDSGSGWDQTLSSFTISPRKGGKIDPPESIKFRLNTRRDGSKDGLKRKILFVSGLSASKIIEFKKGCRKKTANSRKTGGRRGGRVSKRVAPIIETDLEGISPKESPTKEIRDLARFDSDMVLGSEDDYWADEMDSDGPLVWPDDQKNDWNVTCDFLDVSPRKNVVNMNSFGSPKAGFTISGSPKAGFTISRSPKDGFRISGSPKAGFTISGSPKAGFTISGSIRLKFRHNRKEKDKFSKILKFKPESHKTATYSSRKRVKSMPLRLTPSRKNLVIVIPPKKTSLFKQVGDNINGVTRMNPNNGKRIRAMPMKIGKSIEEFLRMVSGDSDSEAVPGIETVMGLNEFDGHEGVGMDFEEGEFSFEECIRE